MLSALAVIALVFAACALATGHNSDTQANTAGQGTEHRVQREQGPERQGTEGTDRQGTDRGQTDEGQTWVACKLFPFFVGSFKAFECMSRAVQTV